MQGALFVCGNEGCAAGERDFWKTEARDCVREEQLIM